MNDLIVIFSILNSIFAFVFGIATIVITYLYNRKKLKLDEKLVEVNEKRYELEVGLENVRFMLERFPELMKGIFEKVYDGVDPKNFEKLGEYVSSKKFQDGFKDYIEEQTKNKSV